MSQTARVEVENIAADCKIKLAKGNQKQFKIKFIWLKNNKKKECFIPAFLQEANLKIAENLKELFNIDSMQKEFCVGCLSSTVVKMLFSRSVSKLISPLWE